MDTNQPQFLDRLAAAIGMSDIYNCGCGDCSLFEAAVLNDIITNHDWDTEQAIFDERLPLVTKLNCSCPVHPNPLWEPVGTAGHQQPSGWQHPQLALGRAGASEYYSKLLVGYWSGDHSLV